MLWREDVNHCLVSYLLDLASTLGAFWLARRIYELIPFSLSAPDAVLESEAIPLPVVAVMLLIWTIASFILSVYDPRRGYKPMEETQSVVTAALVSLMILAGVLYFSYRTISRVFIGYFFLCDLACLLGWRQIRQLLFHVFDGQIRRPRRVLIVGANELGSRIAETIRQYAWTGLRFWGYADEPLESITSGLPILGSLQEIRSVIETHNIEEVVIALHNQTYQKINQIVVDLQALPVQVLVVPDFLSLALYRATVGDFGGLPLISLRTPALTGYQRLTKRAFDVIVATLIIIMIMPLLVAIAIAIKLDSPGPVLFKQQRVGENGRLFTMFKFRSMVIDAEARQASVIQRTQDGEIIHKRADDPRITRIGRLIRTTSLDELPQLFNVVKGDMSLVGPRPEMPWLVERYESWQRQRFAVPQGMTGWWQINGRASKPMHLNTGDDLYYIQNYSFWFDIQILWKTIPAVVRRRGAM